MAREKFIALRANQEEITRLEEMADHCKLTKSSLVRNLLANLEKQIGSQLSGSKKDSHGAEKAQVFILTT